MAEIIQKKKYSDLPQTTTLKDNDMVMVSDGATSKVITANNLKTEITKDIQVDVDTTNLATKTELTNGLNSKANVGHTHNEYATTTQLNAKADASAIPTKTSQLTNDSTFTTEAFVTNKIAEAQLGGGDVDLSGLATIDQLNLKSDKTYVDTELAKKLNSTGHVLTDNNYTTAEKTKLAGLTNYTHPVNHPASIITQDASNRFVTDAEKTTWNAKEPAITKNTAFNKNFGTTAGTVSEGNHAHDTSALQTKIDNNLTGTEKNLVNVVNSNTDKISILNTTVEENKTQLENIATVKLDGHSFKWLTKAEYQALEQSGQLDSKTEYHITDSNEPSVAEISEIDKGKILAVKQDGTGTEWVEKPTGGGNGVSLGETSTTAYRGDRGKIAYDHSQSSHNYTTPQDVSDAIGSITTFPQGNLVLRDIVDGEIFTIATGVAPSITYGQIVLNKTSITITEGSTGTFTVALDKAPTNNQVVTLSKTNADVTLSSNSLTFTPGNYSTPQTVTITVAEDNTDYSNESDTITLTSSNVTNKTVSVTITDNDTAPSNIPVTGVTITPTTATITSIGGTQQLTATVLPVNATNKLVTWSTSNASIATVDNTGKVTSVAEGSTVITCTAKDVTNDAKATCNITVSTTGDDGNNLVTGYKLALLGKNGSGEVWVDESVNNYNANIQRGTWEDGALKNGQFSILHETFPDIFTHQNFTYMIALDTGDCAGSQVITQIQLDTTNTVYIISDWEERFEVTTNCSGTWVATGKLTQATPGDRYVITVIRKAVDATNDNIEVLINNNTMFNKNVAKANLIQKNSSMNVNMNAPNSYIYGIVYYERQLVNNEMTQNYNALMEV